MGYEVVFDKPVTKAQVMDLLVGKNDLHGGVVRLTPVPKEPATVWQVAIIGVDAGDAMSQPPVSAVFTDANVYATPTRRPSWLRTMNAATRSELAGVASWRAESSLKHTRLQGVRTQVPVDSGLAVHFAGLSILRNRWHGAFFSDADF